MIRTILITGQLPDGRKITSYHSKPAGISLSERDDMIDSAAVAYGPSNVRVVSGPNIGSILR